jgi:hypothetical protein
LGHRQQGKRRGEEKRFGPLWVAKPFDELLAEKELRPCRETNKQNTQLIKIMPTILLILLVLLLVGALPAWPYSHSWGYYPSGGLGLVLLILVILLLLGKI